MAKAPGITHNIPLPYGAWGAFLRDPLGFQTMARERYGDVFRFRIGPVLLHFLYRPQDVQRVLHENQKNYLRGWHFRLLRKLFGQNLTTSEGEFWLRQRRLAQPAFHRQKLAEYSTVMVDVAGQLAERWQTIATEERPLDARDEMSRVSLAILSRTLFSRDMSHEADALGKTFLVLGQYFEHVFQHPITSPPPWVPTPTNRRFNRAVATINRVVMDIVRERLGGKSDQGDLLAMLINARDDETGERMTDEQLRSEVLNFLLAGHESTATVLTWTWYLLGSHPSIQTRVREELAAVVGDRPPTVADAAQLRLTRAVIQESMRLYPPIWLTPRSTVADDEVAGYRIPKRSTVILCPYITHRHPEFWDAPEAFDPDRFTDERVASRPKGAYFPFLSGLHQCIGNEFALLEMQLVVARVLQQFDIGLLPGQAIKPAASLGLWPDGPVRLVITNLRRSNQTQLMAQ
ncbi:MAG TPA: cytochrome P450 [Pirellulales bacterium]|nr:cytochrome P450 [Pirellulales bacterium]